MATTTFRVPRTWPQLRATTIAMRAMELPSEEARNNFLHPYLSQNSEAEKVINEALAFVQPYYNISSSSSPPSRKSNWEGLKSKIITNAKLLGPSGHVALCALDNDLTMTHVKNDVGILLLFLHSIILNNPNSDYKITCTGSVDTDPLDAFNSDTNWPEMFPNNWLTPNGDASFRYHVQYTSDPTLNKHATVYLRASKMGGGASPLVVMFLIDGKESPVNFNIKPTDYLSSVNREQIQYCFTSLELKNTGLGQFLPRVAATELANVISNNFIVPVFTVVHADGLQINNSSAQGSNRSITAPDNNRHQQPPPPYFPGMYVPPTRGDYPRPINPVGPRFYGDTDLFPNINPGFGIGGSGGGGNLYGPGHPNFPNPLPQPPGGGVPPGVPPGARFDPFSGVPSRNPGPGRNGGGRGGNRGGRGGGRGGFIGGDPNPDDFPPPGFEEDPGFGFYG